MTPEARARLAESSVFCQAFKQLRNVPASRMRVQQVRGEPFVGLEVGFHGEHAAGLGGPYRQFFSDVFAELQERGAGSTLSLFVPSPNAQWVRVACVANDAPVHVVPGASPCWCAVGCVLLCAQQRGENRDKFVLRPSANSAAALAQFVFLGRLIGAALRTGVLVKLDWPSFVFKPLVGQPVTMRDLELVDKVCVRWCRRWHPFDPRAFPARAVSSHGGVCVRSRHSCWRA